MTVAVHMTEFHFSSREEREQHVRHQSERYGMRFCEENVSRLPQAAKAWRQGDGDPASKISVRVYDRTENAMRQMTLEKILDMLGDAPATNLSPTPFGQIVLSPKVHLSTLIYHVIVMALSMTKDA